MLTWEIKSFVKFISFPYLVDWATKVSTIDATFDFSFTAYPYLNLILNQQNMDFN